MNEEEIHLMGLIGLRALAEFDSAEFRRSTDSSKNELDSKIKALISQYESSDCIEHYKELNSIVNQSESPVEASSLLQQLYLSSFRKTQFYSLKSVHKKYDSESISTELAQSRRPEFSVAEEDELTRLSVMLMLRDLPDYKPEFHHKFKNMHVDCLLEPNRESLPTIVVETKSKIGSKKKHRKIKKSLELVMKMFGKKTLGIVVTEVPFRSLEDYVEAKTLASDKQYPSIYDVVYDMRKNRFIGKGLLPIMERMYDSE